MGTLTDYRTTYLSSIPRQNGPLDCRQTEKRVNRQPDHITCRLLPHIEGQWISRPHYLPYIATHRGSVDIQTTLPAVYCHTQRVSGYPDHITCRILPHTEGKWISRPHYLPSIATHRGSVDIQTTLPAVYCQTLKVNRQPDHITCRLLPNIEGQLTDSHRHYITCRLLSYIEGQ